VLPAASFGRVGSVLKMHTGVEPAWMMFFVLYFSLETFPLIQ